MAKSRAKHWFWTWTILATVHKHRQHSPNAPCEVWENLIILHAHTPREALRKAEKIGRAEAGDCRGSLRLDGKPAVCKFIGVASLGLVHDGLVDGAEITWRLRRCKQSAAKKLPKRRATLIKEANQELGYVQRAVTRAI
jgi:uncharacterized protein DUF4288